MHDNVVIGDGTKVGSHCILGHDDPGEGHAPLTIGTFLWDEVWTNNPDASATFYQGLTGLQAGEFVRTQGNAYRLLTSGDTPRIGILQSPLPELPSVWVSYVRVADAHAITAEVEGLGGRVLIDVTQRDVGGEAALIMDPSGAGIAIQTWTPPSETARL